MLRDARVRLREHTLVEHPPAPGAPACLLVSGESDPRARDLLGLASRVRAGHGSVVVTHSAGAVRPAARGMTAEGAGPIRRGDALSALHAVRTL